MDLDGEVRCFFSKKRKSYLKFFSMAAAWVLPISMILGLLMSLTSPLNHRFNPHHLAVDEDSLDTSETIYPLCPFMSHIFRFHHHLKFQLNLLRLLWMPSQ